MLAPPALASSSEKGRTSWTSQDDDGGAAEEGVGASQDFGEQGPEEGDRREEEAPHLRPSRRRASSLPHMVPDRDARCSVYNLQVRHAEDLCWGRQLLQATPTTNGDQTGVQ